MAISTEDLKAIVTTLKTVIQKGGTRYVQVGGADGDGMLGKIVKFISYFIMILFYCMVVYFVYIIIVRGYPRFLVDIPTLSIYKAQNLHQIMTEKDIIFNHFVTLYKTDWLGVNPHDILQSVVVKNNIMSWCQYINAHIGTSHSYKHLARLQDKFVLSLQHVYSLSESFNVTGKWLQKAYFEEEIINPNIDRNLLPKCKPPPVSETIINPNIKETPCPAPIILIWSKDWEFYYQKTKELLKGNEPTEVEVLQTFYYDSDYYYKGHPITGKGDPRTGKYEMVYHNNRKVDKPYKKDFNTINYYYKELCKELESFSNRLEQIPFNYILTLPINEENLVSQLTNNSQVIWLDNIYNNYSCLTSGSISTNADPKAIVFDQYTFYILEVLRKNDVYVKYDGNIHLPSPPSKVTSMVDRYQKLSAFADTLINQAANAHTLFAPPSQKPEIPKLDFMKSLVALYMGSSPSTRYTLFVKTLASFNMYDGKSEVQLISYRKLFSAIFTWFEKHPIFAHIYLNNDLPTDDNPVIARFPTTRSTQYLQEINKAKLDFKANLYDRTILAYETMMKTNADGTLLPLQTNINPKQIIENLARNGKNVKTLLGAIVVIDLYFNGYRKDMITLFKDQNVTYKEFYHKLWNVYFVAIWEKQILELYRRMFSGTYVRNRLGEFKNLWKKLGILIEKARDQIDAKFKGRLKPINVEPVESGQIEQPPPPPPEPQPQPQPAFKEPPKQDGS